MGNSIILQNFLSKLSVIENKYRVIEESKERFNVFTILYKEHDEVKLHSRFLSVLLSPQGSHKFNNCFLNLFLKRVGLFSFDTASIDVYPTEWEKSEYKEIDILILNRSSKKAIIIENKIYAGDSNHDDRGQLEGYINVVNEDFGIEIEDIHVFYLTLDRHDPTDESLGRYKSNYNKIIRPISYGTEILEWLDCCIREAYNKPFLREVIQQYIQLLKNMTNNIDIQERLDICKLIAASEDNMKSAKLLFENFIHVKWHTVAAFWDELTKRLRNYEIVQKPEEYNITATTHYETYKKDFKNNNDYGLLIKVNSNLKLRIWNACGGDEKLWWGIMQEDKTPMFEKYLKSNRKFQFTVDNQYIYRMFNLDEHELIAFHDFSMEGTFNLIKEDYRLKIIERMVNEINEFVADFNSCK